MLGTISFMVSKPTTPPSYKRVMIHCNPIRDSLNQIFFLKRMLNSRSHPTCAKNLLQMFRVSFSLWPQRKKGLWVSPAASPTLGENKLFSQMNCRLRASHIRKKEAPDSDERYYSFTI